MNVVRWELLEFIMDTEVNDWDVAEAFQVSRHCAAVRLKRAFNWGWLKRKKMDGILTYSLTQKAWDFQAKFGSFINHKYYGYRKKTTEKPAPAAQASSGSASGQP